MNEIQIFNFKDAEVRTAVVDGEPWWLANDICAILGYANPRKAIADHCREGGVTKRDTPTSSGIQSMTFINEGNLYRLISKSKLPAAEAFESWVFDEVLPSIRRQGMYALPRNPITEVDRVAGMLGDFIPAVSGRLGELTSKVIEHDAAIRGAQEMLSKLDPHQVALEAASIEEKRRRLMGELSGELNEIVHRVVARARSLPAEDLTAKPWRDYRTTWRAVHRCVGLGKKADYAMPDQFDKAIQFARNTLRVLGEEPPVQLRLVG